jgi:hypothetical protein
MTPGVVTSVSLSVCDMCKCVIERLREKVSCHLSLSIFSQSLYHTLTQTQRERDSRRERVCLRDEVPVEKEEPTKLT